MAFMLARHRVKDFAKWKPFYDADGPARKAAGCKGAWLFRTADDPNDLVLLFEWDDLDNARHFVQSPELRKVMEQAGVEDQPELRFLEQLERTSA